MRILGLVLGVVLLLTGCAGRQTNALEAWAEQQRATYPGLVVERSSGMFGNTGALVRVTVDSPETAKEFSGAFRGEVENKRLGRFDALITWPVGSGTVTLYESSHFETPAEAWDWADQPLPAAATERRVGWLKAESTRISQSWPREVEYASTSIAETLASAVVAPDTQLSIYNDADSFAGPFPAAEVSDRAGELAQLGPAITGIRGFELTLAPGSDLPTAARALEGHQWWLLLDTTRVLTGPIDYDLLGELHGKGYRLTLTPSELGLGRLTAQACDELLGTLHTSLMVTLSCASGESYASLSGTLADVSHDWEVLSPLLDDFSSVEVRPDRLDARMRDVAQADWAGTVAPLRSLAWPGPRSVDLVADGISVRFSSTQTGPATNTVKGTEKETALVAAWDASAA